MTLDSGPADDGPQMHTVRPLTGTQFAGAAVGWGVVGVGLIVSALINFSRGGWQLGWQSVLVLPAACALLALAVLDFRVTLKLAQLRVETPEDEPTRVPTRMFVCWLLANFAPFAVCFVVGLLSLPTKK